MNFTEIGFRLGIFFVPFLFALCFHEFAHGFIAKMRGDNTAERMGRLSLNPMVHADLLGTWILPILAISLGSGMMFGWAKPVPVDARNLKNPRWDMFWVALAGPLSNILLALVSTVLLAVYVVYGQRSGASQAFEFLLQSSITVNLFLAFFNLIPINPLDGGKVIEPFLPHQWNVWLDQNQSMLSMMLLVFLLLVGGVLSIPVAIARNGLLDLANSLAMMMA